MSGEASTDGAAAPVWSRMGSILFWSVIAAAFIGPGTVTTAASAGAGFGASLLWALAFSTLACLVLQEAAARLTVVSGRSLAAALAQRYGDGLKGWLVAALVLGAVVLGCAAYEAGNILGGVAGAALGVALPGWALTLAVGALAFALLWLGAPRTVARVLSLAVAVMGVAFLVTASSLLPAGEELLVGLLVPRAPAGSGLLILGLVGTTVVPYNLFLGSGLAGGQRLGEMRFGLAVAVLLGGVISMGILVVGTAVEGPFSFPALAAVLEAELGSWARGLFALGLFAAGLSSAVTAPLAAAVTTRGILGRGAAAEGGVDPWHDRSGRFRAVWAGVLGVGLVFGLSGVRPVPAILLAQALNGLLLPLVAIFLLLAMNDRRLLGRRGLNGPGANLILGTVVALTLVLGLLNLFKAGARIGGFALPAESVVLGLAALVAVGLAVPVARAVLRGRRR